MKRRLCISLGIVFLFSVSAQMLVAKDYSHSLTAGKMEFHWSVEGDNLAVKVSAKTKGWVGVGFNPTKRMQGANYVVGYVKGNKVKISDEYGHRKRHTAHFGRGL